MKTSDFDFNLPEELIAQHPIEKRDNSRLMIVDKQTNLLESKHFYDIVDYLNENDVLVLNDTKVIPARLMGLKENGTTTVEVLLLKAVDHTKWEAICKPAKKVSVGTKITFGDGLLVAVCVGLGEGGIRIFDMTYQGIFIEILDQLGTMPLPPYITERLDDANRYQTVYASHPGSAAAPTAGLHFTPELFEKIKQKGVQIIPVTLHIGLGTFRPVNVEDINKHHMHEESYQITAKSAELLNQSVAKNKRIIAIGTTSIRTLESNFENGKFTAGTYDTGIFIYPGYQFRVVDCLITNFHLPKSTLMMLVSAFSSLELMKKAYQKAIDEKYRFFSFGDAMFIKFEKNNNSTT